MTHRHPRIGRVSLVVAVGILAQATLIGLASAQLAPPPPTPVPPDGSLSPFPQSLDTPSDAAVPPALSAPSALLADLDTGQVLFSKDPDGRRPIASLTKIMTGLLVLEQSQPSDIVTVGEDASIPEDDRPGISALGLEVGEQISVEHLLYALLLQSANDAAVALADHVSGSEPRFVRDMNARAAAHGHASDAVPFAERPGRSRLLDRARPDDADPGRHGDPRVRHGRRRRSSTRSRDPTARSDTSRTAT